MRLTQQTLATVDAMLRSNSGSTREIRTLLQEQCAGLPIMLCDASDVLEEPYRNYGNVYLHLVDVRGHCTVMTADPDAATGILLASGSTPP